MRRRAVISRLEAKDVLRRVGTQPDEDIDLAEAALALAALEQPEAELDRYRDHLSLLAREVAELNPPEEDSLEARVAALQDVLVARHGYEGDTLASALLANGVLNRRGADGVRRISRITAAYDLLGELEDS